MEASSCSHRNNLCGHWNLPCRKAVLSEYSKHYYSEYASYTEDGAFQSVRDRESAFYARVFSMGSFYNGRGKASCRRAPYILAFYMRALYILTVSPVLSTTRSTLATPRTVPSRASYQPPRPADVVSQRAPWYWTRQRAPRRFSPEDQARLAHCPWS